MSNQYTYCKPFIKKKKKKEEVPQGVENSSIAEDAYEAVLHRDVMQEGALGVGDEGVGDPEQ